jgi:hypothetical protein
MRTVVAIVLLAVVGAAACIQVPAGKRALPEVPSSVGSDSVGGESGESIPLKSIFATLPGRTVSAFPHEFWVRNKEYRQVEGVHGPSNLFLVEARDLDEAVAFTHGTFTHGLNIDGPVCLRAPDPVRSVWLAVHFGSAQSVPTEWEITAVTVTDGIARVTVRRPSALDYTCDHAGYLAWVPLGVRKEKSLRLEVYDESNRETIMTRLVKLPPAK